MSTKYTKETPYKPVNKFHMSLGNTKIGKILNTNLLAGDDNINGRCTEVGACVGCCDTCKEVCYARKAYRYDAALEANADNTFYARNDVVGYFEDMLRELRAHRSFKYHRWHSSGEIPNYDYLLRMGKIALSTPRYQHYVYTKRYEWVEKYLNEETKPDNLTILLSPPFGCDIKEWSKKYNKHGLPLFIYDKEGDMTIPHCPAVDKKGHKTGVTCDKCGRCPRGETTAVYAH